MTMTQPGVTALWDELCSRVNRGDRFAGLFVTKPEGGPLVLSAHLAVKGGGEVRGAIRGGLVMVGGMPESPWFDPFETAAAELGTPYSVGEIYAFEAFRTGLYAARLPITMIFGIDRTVAEGLGDELAVVVARVPVIVARPDAVAVLAEAGFSRVRRATQTPFNLILEARP